MINSQLGNLKNALLSTSLPVEINEPLVAEGPIAEVIVESRRVDEPANPLDAVWIDEERFEFGDYVITNDCPEDFEDDSTRCRLVLKKSGEILFSSGAPDRTELKFGFFDFLGTGTGQLVIHTKTRGSCPVYRYIIADAGRKYKVLYDSSVFAKDLLHVNSELVPIDIDQDGKMEFTQSIYTFDLFHASHAYSVYPPVVFKYDEGQHSFIIANKYFSSFITEQLEPSFQWLENVADDDEQFETRYAVQNIFLTFLYIGKRNDAWEFYDKYYRFKDKELYRKDVLEELKKDPVYQAIYR